jgi:hypothetical protein
MEHEQAIIFAEARGQKSPDKPTSELKQPVNQSASGADEVVPEHRPRTYSYSYSPVSGFNETSSGGEAPLFMG